MDGVDDADVLDVASRRNHRLEYGHARNPSGGGRRVLGCHPLENYWGNDLAADMQWL
jgi:hypothetical protein